jgi:hypothetical protein
LHRLLVAAVRPIEPTAQLIVDNSNNHKFNRRCRRHQQSSRECPAGSRDSMVPGEQVLFLPRKSEPCAQKNISKHLRSECDRQTAWGTSMRNTFVVVLLLACGLLFLGLDISHHASNGHAVWRVSLAAPAWAQFNGDCEYPPVDEPDGDGDECNPGYATQLNVPKNAGNPLMNGTPDPINFATGGYYDAEKDYAAAGPFPLALTRYYNDTDTGVHKFGAGWRGSYGRALATTSSTVTTLTRDDGQVLTFNLTSGVWTPDSDINYRLTQTGGGWTLITDKDETETYDTNGHLLT